MVYIPCRPATVDACLALPARSVCQNGCDPKRVGGLICLTDCTGSSGGYVVDTAHGKEKENEVEKEG